MALLASEYMSDSTTEKDVQYMHMSDMNDHCSYTCNYVLENRTEVVWKYLL